VNESTTNDGGYQQAEFVITFSYTVQGKTYFGKYTSGSPRDEGHTLEIQYDVSHPEKNTGSDVPPKPWVRAFVWVVCVGLTVLAIWLVYR
jgi:hypothetical protein